MDEQEKISELFRVAREQKPKISFDQTKDQFLNSLKNQTVKTKYGQVFTLKKWIIMLSSIITVAGLSWVLINQTVNTNHLKAHSTLKEETNVRNEESNSISKEIRQSQIQSTERSYTNPINEMNKSLLGASPLFNLNFFDLSPLINKYQGIPFDDTLKTKPFDFPKLSSKQIKNITKQKNEMLKNLVKVDHNKMYAYFPSGDITIDGSKMSIQAFFIQKTEVTNLEYRTFLNDLLIQGRKDEYLKAKPDEELWVKCFSELQRDMARYYFTHPSYDNFPVVNISQIGVEIYCSWLLEEAKKKYPKNDFKYILPRIPTRIEWVYAASSRGKNMVYAWGTDSTRNQYGNYLCNYKPFEFSFFEDGGFHAINVVTYNPSEFGLYNMCGNVAEYVYNLDYSSAKPYENKILGTAGGGWMNNAEEIKILAKDNHPGIVDPHPNVGFRIVFTHLGR